MFQTTSQRHTSHTFIVCHQKKRRSSSGQSVFSMGFWPGAGIQQTQAIPGSWMGHPSFELLAPTEFFVKKKRFSHMFWNKNAVPMVFPRVFFHPPRCLFHVGLVVVLQGLSQHLQRGPHGFGGRLQGAHVLRTQRCGNGEQTDSMVITMV